MWYAFELVYLVVINAFFPEPTVPIYQKKNIMNIKPDLLVKKSVSIEQSITFKLDLCVSFLLKLNAF